MSEWFKELVLKTSDSARNRGFESHSLRQKEPQPNTCSVGVLSFLVERMGENPRSAKRRRGEDARFAKQISSPSFLILARFGAIVGLLAFKACLKNQLADRAPVAVGTQACDIGETQVVDILTDAALQIAVKDP